MVKHELSDLGLADNRIYLVLKSGSFKYLFFVPYYPGYRDIRLSKFSDFPVWEFGP